MQEVNSLSAPVARDLTSQQNENVVIRASSSYFLFFKDAARSAAEPASSDVKGR